MGKLKPGQISKKKLAEIQKRYVAPKDATKEVAQKIARNKTAAIWREKNRDKVRASQRAYAQKAKEKRKELTEQLEEGERQGTTVTPLTAGPVLMYGALSYGSKVTGLINATWIEAESNRRKVVGLISDFEGDIRGPLFTLTGFTAAIQEVFQQGLNEQAKYKIDKKDKTDKGPGYSKYPMIDASTSDDGKTVYITVNCFMM